MKHQLHKLRIIGCTEVISSDPYLPRILSPIYYEPGLSLVLYPPYTIDNDTLVNPVQGSVQEFKEYSQLKQVTFWPAFQPYQTDYVLWVDDLGVFYYDHKTDASEKLQVIYNNKVSQAKELLNKGELEKARNSILVAGAIKPNNLEPLQIRLEIELAMQSQPDKFPWAVMEYNLTEFLIKDLQKSV
jgi:hypothetical protein